MINKKYISKLANESLENTNMFVVGIVVSADNIIKVFIDGDTGVTIKNCVDVSRYIENNLNREDADFELNVSSAGLDHPFEILRQYTNNLGNSVSIIKKDGIKIKGILKSANDDTVEVLEQLNSKNKKNKKITYGKVISVKMSDVKETKRIITF